MYRYRLCLKSSIPVREMVPSCKIYLAHDLLWTVSVVNEVWVVARQRSVVKPILSGALYRN